LKLTEREYELKRISSLAEMPENFEGIRELLYHHIKNGELSQASMDQKLDALLQLTQEKAERTREEEDSLKELIGILKGLKFMKRTTVILAGIIASVIAGWDWLSAHFTISVK